MISLAVALTLLVAHFVADWLCQTDWMALNKSKRWDALAAHVATYSYVLFACLLASGALRHGGGQWRALVANVAFFTLVNGAVHFGQDAVTSRWTSQLWFFRLESGIWTQAEYTVPQHGRTIVNPYLPDIGNRHWFFVVIGLDQLLHYAVLFTTATWWLV